ncbi:MAG: hypothetical protein ABI243_10440 [Lapillicoccus sp.]
MIRIVDDWAARISWRWGVTAIVALVTVLVVTLVVAFVPRGGSPAAATATSGQGSVPLLPPSSVTDPPPSSPATPTTVATASVAPDEVMATTAAAVSGPGVTEAGISLWVTPQMDGSLEVMEAAMYLAPVEVLTLVPVDVRDGGPSFAPLVPTVTHLQMTADGSPVGVLPSMTGRTTVTLPTGARQVRLRYHLDGVTVRSTPSSTGRASILIAPLSVPTDASLPAQIRIAGRPVLNLTCPRLRGDAQSCAPATGDSGVAPILTARDDVVIAQVDLPSPS